MVVNNEKIGIELNKRRRLEIQLFGGKSKPTISLHNADCRDILKILPKNSIHSLATDTPYNLSSTGDPSKGFMNKDTDGNDAFDPDLWAQVLSVLVPGGHVLAFGSPRTVHRMVCPMEDAGFEIIDSIAWLYGNGMLTAQNISKAMDKKAKAERKVIGQIDRGFGRQFAEGCSGFKRGIVDITEPSTQAAKQWEGWRPRLKPSHEVIVVARKPVRGLVVDNVRQYDCGALNLEACKLKNGNLPTNTIISEEIAEALKDKARFFYCPKPSKKERNRGCEHIIGGCRGENAKQRTYLDRCAVCGKKSFGSDETRCQCPLGVKQTDLSLLETGNYHNTVKPLKLMEYLVKLVTPPNGVCMDIFGGSGTTAVACVYLGIDCILIEKDKGYFEIAKARVAYAQGMNSFESALSVAGGGKQ